MGRLERKGLVTLDLKVLDRPLRPANLPGCWESRGFVDIPDADCPAVASLSSARAILFLSSSFTDFSIFFSRFICLSIRSGFSIASQGGGIPPFLFDVRLVSFTSLVEDIGSSFAPLLIFVKEYSGESQRGEDS